MLNFTEMRSVRSTEMLSELSKNADGNVWKPNAMLKKRDFQDPNPPQTHADFYGRYDPSVGIMTAMVLGSCIGLLMVQILLKYVYKKWTRLRDVYDMKDWRTYTRIAFHRPRLNTAELRELQELEEQYMNAAMTKDNHHHHTPHAPSTAPTSILNRHSNRTEATAVNFKDESPNVYHHCHNISTAANTNNNNNIEPPRYEPITPPPPYADKNRRQPVPVPDNDGMILAIARPNDGGNDQTPRDTTLLVAPSPMGSGSLTSYRAAVQTGNVNDSAHV